MRAAQPVAGKLPPAVIPFGNGGRQHFTRGTGRRQPVAAQCLRPPQSVAITADLLGHRLYGSIDRLLITDSTVLAVDYKSNHLIPQTAAQIPEGLLRQLGAYAHALQQIYPTRRIETAILWTRSAELMMVDPDIVSAALLRATIDSMSAP